MSQDIRHLGLDAEGFWHSQGARIDDADWGYQLLSQLHWSASGAIQTQHEGHTLLVEAFDQPLVAQSLDLLNSPPGYLTLNFPYQYRLDASLKELRVDEWDRIHGRAGPHNIPFVLSHKAQAAFFEALTEYNDDQFFFQSQWWDLPYLYQEHPPVQSAQFWTERYQNTPTPGWELNQAHPGLVHLLPQLKLNRSRILVLGCGSGNDAAFFAEQGHIVVAVDFSPKALELAQKKYGHLKQIEWLEFDILDPSFKQYLNKNKFDLVFDHTCYCALPPRKRKTMSTLWPWALNEDGYLLGIFFTMWQTHQPPFGSSEWEFKQRLDSHFRYLYWYRLKGTAACLPRLGKELIVLAQKNQENNRNDHKTLI